MDRGLGDALLDIAQEHLLESFDRQIAPDGTPWEALSDAYDERKQREYPGTPMGVRTGHMRDGLRLGSGSRELDDRSAEWTYGDTDLQRSEAEWFHSRRKFIDTNEAMIAEVKETIGRHVRENL